jgi:MFS family permease
MSVRALVDDRFSRRAVVALALYRVAEFGPWVAILVYAYDHGGATATGLVSLGILIPTALFAPLAGPAIDRFGATRVLRAAYATQATVMGATAVALLSGSPSAVVYLLAALTAMVLTVTHPAHAVACPGLARATEQLVALNALTGWVLNAGLVLAPAIAGLILAVSTPGTVYAVGAAALAAAAVLVSPCGDLVPPIVHRGELGASDALRQLVDGARAIKNAAAPREVMLVLVTTFMMIGAFDVLAVSLALGTLGIGGSGAGYLAATHGVGAVLGAAASLAVLGRGRLVPLLIGAALLGGLAFLLLGLRTTLVVAFGAAALAGVSRSLLEVIGQTLLQRVTSTELLARVFAFKEGLAMAAWGIGSALVPLVISLGGMTAAVIFTGALVPIAVLVRLPRLLAVDSAGTVPVVTITLLRSLRVFRALPVPALEGVARSAIEKPVPAGTEIVREGEQGNSYYAIADGTVEVLKKGRRIASMSRGEGFGEMALLGDGVRTATVLATTDARLIQIERAPFLVAVTGHSETQGRFHEEVATRLAGQQIPT